MADSSPGLFNLFAHGEGPFKEEQFETLVRSEHVKIERIVSTGQVTPPGEWYDQEQDEWVTVLSGSARLVLMTDDGEQTVDMGPGDAVHIPAHQRHRVVWTDEECPTVWLTVHIW